MFSKFKVSPLILLIIVLAVATTSLAIVKIFKNSEKCSYQDKIICKFLSKTKKYFQNDFSVTLISTVDDKEIKEVWKKQNNFQEFSQYADRKEIFEILLTEKELYVKDMNDNQWWKQTVPQKNSIEKRLPQQLNIAQKVRTQWQQLSLTAPKVNYKQIGKELCGKDMCYKYQIVRPEVSDMTEFVFIDSNSSLYKVRHEFPDGMVKELVYELNEESLEAPNEIKKSLPAQNIFANIQPVSEEKKNLDYLKEFQNNLKEDKKEEIKVDPNIDIPPEEKP
jgi:hypothetical protein